MQSVRRVGASIDPEGFQVGFMRGLTLVCCLVRGRLAHLYPPRAIRQTLSTSPKAVIGEARAAENAVRDESDGPETVSGVCPLQKFLVF